MNTTTQWTTASWALIAACRILSRSTLTCHMQLFSIATCLFLSIELFNFLLHFFPSFCYLCVICAFFVFNVSSFVVRVYDFSCVFLDEQQKFKLLPFSFYVCVCVFFSRRVNMCMHVLENQRWNVNERVSQWQYRASAIIHIFVRIHDTAT